MGTLSSIASFGEDGFAKVDRAARLTSFFVAPPKYPAAACCPKPEGPARTPPASKMMPARASLLPVVWRSGYAHLTGKEAIS